MYICTVLYYTKNGCLKDIHTTKTPIPIEPQYHHQQQQQQQKNATNSIVKRGNEKKFNFKRKLYVYIVNAKHRHI